MRTLGYLSTYLIVCVSLAAGLMFCQSSAQDQQQNSVSDLGVTFEHKVEAQYAQGFRISYHENYKLLEILKPFQNQVDTLRYSLVPREITEHVDIENTREIPIPVRSLIATSTTHLALTNMLDANDILAGMVGADYVYNPGIRDRIKSGEIAGFPMGEINKEKVLTMQPDLVMVSGGQSSQFDNYRVLMKSGIDVIANSEWMETSPLGKAEWVKVMAALLNKEQLANQKFNAVSKKYNELEAAVDKAEEKPLVINNLPYKGAWFVPGGGSFTANFLRDAQADYPWFDNSSTGGLRKGFESVYKVGLHADVWLNPGAAKSKEEILAKDSRFKDFKSFQNGAIYNNNRRMSPAGGNDFWESGVVHPEIILADLIKIFHPNILPGHELYYYQQIN